MVTIFHSASAAAQVAGAGSSVGVLQALAGYASTDRTGTPLFEFSTPGFERNAVELVTCDFENPLFPGVYFRGSLLFTPAA